MATSLMDMTDRPSLALWLKGAARRLLGLGLLAGAAFLAAALLSHAPGDPSLNSAASGRVLNLAGTAGAVASDLLLQLFGLAAWLLPMALLAWGLRLALAKPAGNPWLPFPCLLLCLMAATAVLAPWPAPGTGTGMGGVMGDVLRRYLEGTVPPAACFWGGVLLALLFAALAFGLRRGEGLRALQGFGRGSAWVGRRVGAGALEASHLSGRAVGGGLERLRARRRDRDDDGEGRLTAFFGGRFKGHGAAEANPAPAGRRRPSRPPVRPRVDDQETGHPDGTEDKAGRRAPTLAEERQGGLKAAVFDLPEDDGDDDEGAPPLPRPAKPRRNAPVPAPTAAGFVLPDLDRLHPAPKRRSATQSQETLREVSERLETVLDDFGVRGQIIDAKQGPVITLHELEPAPGTRSQRVISLADDIARSLCALSVRVATVPGRNIIGVELPNDARETVFLRELLEDASFADTNARLPLALGKDISGNPITVDLARMPHLLIAGTTGSGKSVAINAMILSLLYRLDPEQCRIIMIDPKVVELSVYEDIPHLLAPVVTEPHKAVVALKWVVRQMDERYRLMNHMGVRDIFTFNRRVQAARERGEELTRRVRVGFEPGTGQPIIEDQPIDMTPLPLIVVIVDEVADLMLTAGKEIENAIQRLSQKARAAGIHLIVATQRPSVDVLTGVIKANLPSRISFRVSSKIDSRTILGEPGAEQLLGQGDMLYMMPGDRIMRIHGPLVTDEEVEEVVKHLRLQGQPDYVEEVTSEAGSDGGDGCGGGADAGAAGAAAGAGGEDGVYDEAVQVVARDGKASTSYLQRKLSIGYNTAAKLIERMEDDGLISRADHVGRRQVLMGRGGIDGTDRTTDDD